MKTLRWTAGSLAIFVASVVLAGCGSIAVNNPNAAQASNGAGSSSGNGTGAGTTGTGSGSGSTGTGTDGSGSTGSGTTGTGSTGSGTDGSGTTGTGTTGTGTSGTGSTGSGSGSGTAGTGTTGTGTSGTGSAGSGSDGSGTTGTGTTGTGTTGTGSAGSGSDGSGTTGTGTTGTGTTGTGTTGTGSTGSGSGSGASAGALALVPANALRVDSIQAMSNWKADYDSATSGPAGSAHGASSLVETPSLSGAARQFTSDYTYYGGERFHASFGNDTTSKHFLYDVWVYLDSSVSSVANLEMDMNETMPNGQTVIFGFQCDGWSNTWDYTTNAGTPEVPVDRWLKSDQACNLQDWTLNTWHHVQVAYSRDDVGNVTYQSVWLDDEEQDINQTTPSAFALGWGSSLITNLQVDGRSAGSGSSTMYLDKLTLYRW